MTDPIKAIADAARKALNHWCPTHCDSDHFVCPTLYLGKTLDDCTCGAAQEFAEHAELSKALAAYDASQSPPSDAEIDDWESRTMKWLHDEVDLTDLGRQEWQSHLDDAKRLMRRARPEPATGDAQLETLIDAVCEAAYAVSDAPDYDKAAEAELAAQKALTDWVGQRIAAVERERDGLLRTEFGISSYPVPGKASDGWPDSFSVWRLKDGRTRIYRQAVAPTDADVEGCNAAELREALFNRNNDVERLVEQRDGLLRAAKEAMRLGMCIDALDILRAEVARVEGA